MKNSIEGVAYLLRKTNMTLSDVRKLDLAQFRDLFEEVVYQESLDEYQRAKYVASLIASIANSVPRKHPITYKASDFINWSEPERGTKIKDAGIALESLAKKAGIDMPKGG